MKSQEPLLVEESLWSRFFRDRCLGALLLGAGLLSVFFYLRPLSKQSKWPIVPGTVIGWKLSCGPCGYNRGNTPYWNLWVEFSYELGGSPYSQEQVWSVGSDRSDAERERLRYSPGTAVSVHYNPANFSDAVIHPGRIPSWGIQFSLLGFVLSVVGAGKLVLGKRVDLSK